MSTSAPPAHIPAGVRSLAAATPLPDGAIIGGLGDIHPPDYQLAQRGQRSVPGTDDRRDPRSLHSIGIDPAGSQSVSHESSDRPPPNTSSTAQEIVDAHCVELIRLTNELDPRPM